MDTMLDFYKERVRGRPKLISVVGDKNKVNIESLTEYGVVTEISLDELFVD